MNKKSLSLLIVIILILSITVPVFAETIIEDNPQGVAIDEILADQVMENNNGTVAINKGKINNNNGTVVSNRSGAIIGINNYRVHANEDGGIIETNNCEVWVNAATIKINNDYVETNLGIIEENSGTVVKNNSDSLILNKVVNTIGGKVEENNANVSGGSIGVNNGTAEYATIEKNYSKEVINSTINNNYSDEVGENNIIKKNFAKKISNATVENQYYKLTIIGNINLEATIDLDGDLTNNIFVDSEGQSWIRAEDAMYTIKAKKGYRIIDEDVIVNGETSVTFEGPRQLGLVNVSGEIIVEAETEEIPTFKVVFDANGGEFSNGTEILTYEKWLPDDYESLENPTRAGYEFLGYFTQKDGGTNFANYYSESGVDQDMTLYAHWMENSAAGEAYSQPDSSVSSVAGNSNLVTQTVSNNPQTGNSILIWFALLLISIVGLMVTRKNKM